ncbi:hypothetical protein B0H16DRAFT_1460212 [Mycena metata]|uniref:Uncharacterized protein n=1 Tax=Mycena metata TaxID=1033252 RepID=A0AAD7IVX3_9AGAR|nr:hypothetical protein B0H16DRAFT_1460212 [Mycena metata]
MANYTGDLPFNLPLACIRQISLPAPSILLCLAYPQNPWIGRSFTTQAGALLEGNEYCTFARCGMAWILEFLRRRLVFDISPWQIGAALGMLEAEFLSLAREIRTSDTLQMRHTRARSYWLCLTLDSDVARLIRPKVTHVGILRDHLTCAIFVLPYRVQDSTGSVVVSRMDQVMHRILASRQHGATVFFVHSDDAADHNIISENPAVTLSVASSTTSSRSSSVAPSFSSSSSDGGSSTSSDGITFLY